MAFLRSSFTFFSFAAPAAWAPVAAGWDDLSDLGLKKLTKKLSLGFATFVWTAFFATTVLTIFVTTFFATRFATTFLTTFFATGFFTTFLATRGVALLPPPNIAGDSATRTTAGLLTDAWQVRCLRACACGPKAAAVASANVRRRERMRT